MPGLNVKLLIKAALRDAEMTLINTNSLHAF